MVARKITKDVHAVGVIHWDRRLFDELIPTPDGTSYNSYLVRGSEKTALIDTVDPEMVDELLENLENLEVLTLDYIISNHTEQDHSGSIPILLERYPEARVVTNKKCRDMLISHLHLPEDVFIVKKDRETLSLGNKNLEFIIAPWVHWPETMFTFLPEDRILFSCDFLGSHMACSSIFVQDEAKVYESAKRYFAEIMMPFRAQIRRHLDKIQDLDIRFVAPSHGPVYPKPEFIINAYRDWCSDEVKGEVILPYISMHGSTKKMVEYFTGALIDRGIVVKPFNLARTDLGELAISLVDAATIILGTPALLVGPHPAAVYATYLVNALRPKTKFASIIGSFGWGCQVIPRTQEMLSNLKLEFLGPVMVKGHPKEEDFRELDRLADDILAKHRELGL